LETVLDFTFVPEFLAATSLLEPTEVCRTELKPFLTIFGTSMRAIFYALNTFAKRYIASTSEIDEIEPARIA
jgi:hypothetical protein